MAERVSPVTKSKTNSLMCPLCHDTFQDAKLLNCGHTFCSKCLETYDRSHRHLDHMICPMCRKTTKFYIKGRVKGLASNITVNNLVDELSSAAKGARRSVLSDDLDNSRDLDADALFTRCEQLLQRQNGETGVRDNIDHLVERGIGKKDEIEKNLSTIKVQKERVKSAFDTLESEVKWTCENKVKQLEEGKKELLHEIKELQKSVNGKFDKTEKYQRQIIKRIKQKSVMLISYRQQDNLEGDNLSTYNEVCKELDELLQKRVAEGSAIQITDSAMDVKFVATEDGPANLGRLITEKPTLNIINVVNLRDGVFAMAAVSHDHIAVGYWSENGSDIYSVDGFVKQHVKKKLGRRVTSLAFLSDGRSVVSEKEDILQLYNADGSPTNMKFNIPRTMYFRHIGVDQNDNIFVVNGIDVIYKFEPTDREIKQELFPVKNHRRRICTTKSGTLVTYTCASVAPCDVTLYDREGNEGSCLTRPSDSGFLYAAVDCHDRLYVAWIRPDEEEENSEVQRQCRNIQFAPSQCVVSLSRYTLDGNYVRDNAIEFEPKKLVLHGVLPMCQMVCLPPNKLVIGSANLVYFMEVPV